MEHFFIFWWSQSSCVNRAFFIDVVCFNLFIVQNFCTNISIILNTVTSKPSSRLTYCVYVSCINEGGTSLAVNPRKGSSGGAGVRLRKKQFQIVSADTSFQAALTKFTASNTEIDRTTSVAVQFSPASIVSTIFCNIRRR